ncbi:MAG: fatty acid desaturase [Elusimicrobia bacterium]|nr:fatty acid desaturase [Elusimicrobiota bacterium]
MNKFVAFLRRVDWVNTAFLTLTPVIAIGGTAFLAVHHAIHWATVWFAVVMAVITGIAITGGYHRLFAHKSYDAAWPYRLFMLLFGAAAFENSALRWASDHRTHHKFVDTPKDPYNIKQGFFHAHMGWVMMKYDPAHQYDNVGDLEQDPLIRFQNRHYVSLGILFGFLMPTLVAALWGDALGGFFIAGFLRTVMNHHFTFSINSFAHLIGRQPYSDRDSSRDSWVLALVTYGEGYHNYHHRFPSDYRNGIRAYHWDPTKWLVKGLEAVGLTYNLRQIPNETILRARLKMDEKRMLDRLTETGEFKPSARERVAAARLRLEEAYTHFRARREEYVRLKQQQLQGLSATFHTKMEELRVDMRRANARLDEAARHWGDLCGKFGIRGLKLIYN